MHRSPGVGGNPRWQAHVGCNAPRLVSLDRSFLLTPGPFAFSYASLIKMQPIRICIFPTPRCPFRTLLRTARQTVGVSDSEWRPRAVAQAYFPAMVSVETRAPIYYSIVV
jgi:hypothetical protein